MPARGPGAHQREVVGDLGERDREHLERAGQLHQRVAVPLRLERVLGRADVEPRVARQPLAHAGGELRVRVEARAGRRAAERDLRHARQRVGHAGPAEADLRRVAGELLPERHRHRVHQVGAARLHDVLERLGLGGEGRLELLERGQQPVRRLVERGEVDGAGEHVVGGLAHVHVIVRVGALAGQRRDDLVRVHVRGRAGAGLEDVDGELARRGGPRRSRRPRRRSAARGPRRAGPRSALTRAAAPFTRPSHRTTATGTGSPDTGKFATALRVSPPHSSCAVSCTLMSLPPGCSTSGATLERCHTGPGDPRRHQPPLRMTTAAPPVAAPPREDALLLAVGVLAASTAAPLIAATAAPALAIAFWRTGIGAAVTLPFAARRVRAELRRVPGRSSASRCCPAPSWRPTSARSCRASSTRRWPRPPRSSAPRRCGRRSSAGCSASGCPAAPGPGRPWRCSACCPSPAWTSPCPARRSRGTCSPCSAACSAAPTSWPAARCAAT